MICMMTIGTNPFSGLVSRLFPRYQFSIGKINKTGNSKQLSQGAARAITDNTSFYSEFLDIEPSKIMPKIVLKAQDDSGIITGSEQLTMSYMQDKSNYKTIRLGLCIDFPAVNYEFGDPGGYGYKGCDAEIKDRAAAEIFTAQQASMEILNPAKRWEYRYAYGINPVFDGLTFIGNHFDRVRFPKEKRKYTIRKEEKKNFWSRGKIAGTILVGLTIGGAAIGIDSQTGVFSGLTHCIYHGFGDYGFACRAARVSGGFFNMAEGGHLYEFKLKDKDLAKLSDSGLVIVGKLDKTFDRWYSSSPDSIAVTDRMGSLYLAGKANLDEGIKIFELQRGYPHFQELSTPGLQVVSNAAGQISLDDLKKLPNFLEALGLRYSWLAGDGISGQESQWLKFWYDTCLQRYIEHKYVTDVKSMPAWQAQYLMGFTADTLYTRKQIDELFVWDWAKEAAYDTKLALGDGKLDLGIVNNPTWLSKGKIFYELFRSNQEPGYPAPKPRSWDQLDQNEKLMNIFYEWDINQPATNAAVPKYFLLSEVLQLQSNRSCGGDSSLVSSLQNTIGVPSALVNYDFHAPGTPTSEKLSHDNPAVFDSQGRLQILEGWPSVSGALKITPVDQNTGLYVIWEQNPNTGEYEWELNNCPHPLFVPQEAKEIGKNFQIDLKESG